MNESEIFNLAHQKVIFDHPSYRSSPAVGEDFFVYLRKKSTFLIVSRMQPSDSFYCRFFMWLCRFRVNSIRLTTKNASVRSWLHLPSAVLTELWGCRNRRYLFSKVFRLRLRRSTPAVGEDFFLCWQTLHKTGITSAALSYFFCRKISTKIYCVTSCQKAPLSLHHELKLK